MPLHEKRDLLLGVHPIGAAQTAVTVVGVRVHPRVPLQPRTTKREWTHWLTLSFHVGCLVLAWQSPVPARDDTPYDDPSKFVGIPDGGRQLGSDRASDNAHAAAGA